MVDVASSCINWADFIIVKLADLTFNAEFLSFNI